MKRNLLLTVSEDVSALYGVRFVNSFMANKDGLEITLLYVAQPAEGAKSTACSILPVEEPALTESQCTRGYAALEAAHKLLLDRGFADDHIKKRLVNKRFGTVRDIIREAKIGLFDALVLGRRGYYLFERALATSVSREVMEHRIEFPIWVCRMPEESRKNVLLCVDDSEPSRRIADHVGFILEKEEQHSITLLHVNTGKREDSEAILTTAEEALKANGIGEHRIRRLMSSSHRIAKAILEELDRGRYAAVAVGRGGSESQASLSKWFMGSVSMKLLETLDRAVLWVSK
jgi:nucleotide-binding universal stress UspA family protein